jgi:hypothetical protein
VILLCHEDNLLLIQTREREHANLLHDVAPIARCTCRPKERELKDVVRPAQQPHRKSQEAPHYTSLQLRTERVGDSSERLTTRNLSDEVFSTVQALCSNCFCRSPLNAIGSQHRLGQRTHLRTPQQRPTSLAEEWRLTGLVREWRLTLLFQCVVQLVAHGDDTIRHSLQFHSPVVKKLPAKETATEDSVSPTQYK